MDTSKSGIDITLILPLRSQPIEFNRLMESIISTTDNICRIEVLVVIDDDDEKTIKEDYGSRYDIVKVLITKRSEFFVRDYYNWAAKQAQGRWIITLNSDSLFMTKGWDTILKNRLEEAAKSFGDDIVLGIVKDGLPRCEDGKTYPEGIEVRSGEIRFCCWTITSKEFVNMFGGVLDERIPAWGADHILGEVFPQERKVYIFDILIDHICSHTRPGMNKSIHYKRFSDIIQKHRSWLTEEELKESSDKIRNYIKGTF